MSKIGIIGGSGLYKMDGLEGVKEIDISTPYGNPSDKFVTARLEGKEVVFLPRHGRNHTILPTEVNNRANIYGMKKLGADMIISVSAVGSLKKEIKPLDMVVVSQFVDRTNQGRGTTFFGDGIVAHIPFAEPVCPELSRILYDAGCEIGASVHNGGTYINMEGPAFSTLAESYLYKSWGVDVIGMTNMPEARLAREAEICYATLAMVTDYDCWCLTEEGCTVTVDLIIENLNKNAATAKKLVKKAVGKMQDKKKGSCNCADALKDAFVTSKDLIPAKRRKELDIIIGKYL